MYIRTPRIGAVCSADPNDIYALARDFVYELRQARAAEEWRRRFNNRSLEQGARLSKRASKFLAQLFILKRLYSLEVANI